MKELATHESIASTETPYYLKVFVVMIGNFSAKIKFCYLNANETITMWRPRWHLAANKRTVGLKKLILHLKN